MADCYFHGQSSPGACPEGIAEGEQVYKGGRLLTAADARAIGARNEELRQPGFKFQAEEVKDRL